MQQADIDIPAHGTPDRMHKVTLMYAIVIENVIKGKVVPDAGVDMQMHLLRMCCVHAMLSEIQALAIDGVDCHTRHWEVRDALISTTCMLGAGLSGNDFAGSAISDPAMIVRDPVPTVVPECVLAFLNKFAPNRA
jgi:hypothetical protein